VEENPKEGIALTPQGLIQGLPTCQGQSKVCLQEPRLMSYCLNAEFFPQWFLRIFFCTNVFNYFAICPNLAPASVTFPKTNVIGKSFPLRQILSLRCVRLYFTCALPIYGLLVYISYPTNEFMVMKISQYYVFAVCDNVAPWNRHQERRRMPGLLGPQPSFLSKIPIL